VGKSLCFRRQAVLQTFLLIVLGAKSKIVTKSIKSSRCLLILNYISLWLYFHRHKKLPGSGATDWFRLGSRLLIHLVCAFCQKCHEGSMVSAAICDFRDFFDGSDLLFLFCVFQSLR